MEKNKNVHVEQTIRKEMAGGNIARTEQEEISKEMAGGFNSLAKHEAMIKRMEEVKRDSIKLKLFEEILKELKIIKSELKAINLRNGRIDGEKKLQQELSERKHLRKGFECRKN